MEKHLLESYMRRCIDLARFGQGHTAPNPNVGSIIVHKNKIIGEGYHQIFGQAHAEDLAIQDALNYNPEALKKSTIFISLEPCYHHGHTPPCVDLILKHQIPKVVISHIDPNPQVAGKSIQKLRDRGVEVITQILEQDGKDVIKPFISRIYGQRPYVTLKVAVDRNGNMASQGKSVWLSNYLSKVYVHRLRSRSDAILVGANTVITDNPALNNRHFYGKSPRIYIYDRDLTLSSSHQIFSAIEPLLIFTKANGAPAQNKKDFEYISLENQRPVIPQILNAMHEQGVNSLFVEGGRKTFQQFQNHSLWDELIVIHTSSSITENPIPFPQFKGQLKDHFKLGNDEVKHWFSPNLNER